MQQMTVEAKAVATDQGLFSAIAATYSIDRQREQIVRGAFEKTIARWQGSGKMIPLHYDHKGDASSIIGTVDPTSMAETDRGLYVEGQLDLEDSEVARQAWRSMKVNRMSLSFGFLATRSRKRSDGVRELSEIDLFEISVVQHPANPDTRFLSLKSSADPETKRREAVHRLMYDLVSRVPDQPCSKAVERQWKSAEPVKVATFRVD